MHFEVTFKGLRRKEEIRRRAQQLFRKLSRFLDPAAEGHLVISAEHDEIVSELVVTTKKRTHHAKCEETELRASVDRAFHRLEIALRRTKERRVDRWHRRDHTEQGPEWDEVVENEVASLEEMRLDYDGYDDTDQPAL